jgi:CheY-like chemotaxis protein
MDTDVNFTHIVSGKRILLAVRCASTSMLLAELLRVDRHQVTPCGSGMAALKLLTKQEFDLLLLDDNLEDMDGVRVLQTYRFGRIGAAPALLLTADDTVQTASRIKDSGAAGILYIPVNLARIRTTLSGLGLPVTTPARRPQSIPGALKSAAVPLPNVSSDFAKTKRPALAVVPTSALDETVLSEVKSVIPPESLATWLLAAERDITACCQQVVDALASQDYASVSSLAVTLKGASASVGAARLVALAGTLLSMTGEKLHSSRAQLATDIRDSSRATIQALTSERGASSVK